MSEIIKPAHINIMWRMHQPPFKDPGSGTYALPFTRLHALKDYGPMLRYVEKFPNMRATFNFTPALLVQIEDYARGASELAQRISLKKVEDLTADEKRYILASFLPATLRRVIEETPRYKELRELRETEAAALSGQEVPKRYTAQDYLDLQVWFNLAMFPPITIEEDKEIKDLYEKGKNFSEGDKVLIFKKQKEYISQIIPKLRDLAARQQIELTTTPFYHPMLPLLFDTSAAQMGMPWLNLSRGLYHYPEDAKAQVDMAIEYHKRTFGALPAGMWPAEGSYSEQVIPIIRGAGIQWIASGQTNLANSLHLMDGRSKDAKLSPEELYFPWLIGQDKNGLRAIFRDHALSNKIGYEYQTWKAEDAVNNLFGDIYGIRNAFLNIKDERPPLINIILDGENWQEFYPRNAFDFLSQLYDRLGQDPQVIPTTVSGYLGKYDHAPSNILTKQWAGSWAGGTFDTWIGAKRANIAWTFLAKTRGTIKLYQGSSCHQTPEWKERIAEALNHLYIAEASDWYWWYGEKHHSEDDAKYDFLYRRHLMYAYSALGLKAPPEMTWPIREHIPADETKSPEYLSRHAPKKGIAPKRKRRPNKEIEVPYIIKKLGIFEMEGGKFESFLVELFRKNGYKAERIMHDDIGADLILRKDGKKIAVQAKRYKKPVGMDAVRAVIGAMKPLECQGAMVITTAKFTYRAKKLALDNGVELWDGERLAKEISKTY